MKSRTEFAGRAQAMERRHGRWYARGLLLLALCVLLTLTSVGPLSGSTVARELDAALDGQPAPSFNRLALVATAITSRPNHQIHPAIAYNSQADEYLVVWEDEYSATDRDIYARRVGSDGIPIGGEFAIAASSVFQSNPAVAYSPVANEYLVVWEHEYSASDYDIYARRVGGGGTPTGSEFGVATSGNFESSPAVAYNTTNDEYLIIWERLTGSGELVHRDIYGRRLDADGTPLGDSAIADGIADQSAPALAYGGVDGQYLVVWQDIHPERLVSDIYGRRVGDDGTPVGGEIGIATRNDDQGLPRLAFNRVANEFLVVWEEHHRWGEEEWDMFIYGQRVNADGTLVGGDFGISWEGANHRQNPDVAYNLVADEYLVTWEHESSLGGLDVYRRRVQSDGVLLEGERMVSGGSSYEGRPALASGSERSYLIVWEDGRSSVVQGIDIYGSVVDLATSFRYVVDPDLQPEVSVLPGLSGGPDRQVVAMLAPDGGQDDFVVDEVIFYTSDLAAVEVFAATYGAEILEGGLLPAPPANLPPDKLRPEYANADDYLLRVNLNLADMSNFEDRMEELGFEGEYRFSSEGAVQLIAVVAKERLNDLDVSPNALMPIPPDQSASNARLSALSITADNLIQPMSADCVLCATEEYPQTGGGHANGFDFSWLNDTQLQVTRAWQYYDLLEITSPSTVLAMVDYGFALNADFTSPANIPQYDFIQGNYVVNNKPNSYPTGGTWHGTGTMGLAAARLNNRFGTAGTGGQAASLYLLRPDASFKGVAKAIRTAVYWGADVVNVSAAAETAGFGRLLAQAGLNKAAGDARNAGVIVLVTAGNNGKDMDNTTIFPCEIGGMLCVAGIDMGTKNATSGSNYGSSVDIWGPYNGLATTPDPSYTGNALPGFGGTCGASAYVAGVVTLMKAINPSLDYNGVVSLLQDTANTSTDPKVASAGYVNAYAAVKAAATSAGLQPQGDSYEPNDFFATARSIAPGSYTGTIAPGDRDYFTFKFDDYMENLQLVIQFRRAGGGNGLELGVYESAAKPVAGTFSTVPDTSVTFQSSGMMAADQDYYAEIEGSTDDSINCYTMDLSATLAAIQPDHYDDGIYPDGTSGEPRNDGWSDAALIELKQKGYKESPLLPGVVEIGGRGANRWEDDLNFDTTSDIDFFEIQIDPDFEYSPELGTECPADPLSVPEDYKVLKEEKASLRITSFPNRHRAFNFVLRNSSGQIVQPAPFIESWPWYVEIECPKSHFPDGVVIVSVQDSGGKRNFYDIDISYQESYIVARDPNLVPEPVFDPQDIEFIAPLDPGPLHLVFPADPETVDVCLSGNCPDEFSSEYLAFIWPERADLKLDIAFLQGGELSFTLLNAAGEPVTGASWMSLATPWLQEDGVSDKRLEVLDLAPGLYFLQVDGDTFGTQYVLNPPRVLYLPVVLRH